MEVSGAEVVARFAAGEQPPGRRVASSAGSGCDVDLGSNQLGERVQEGLEVLAEAESGGGVETDVVGGELHGGGDGLGVEEGERPADPHGKVELVVVEQAAEELELVVTAESAAGPESSGGHAHPLGPAGLPGPEDERSDVPAGGGRVGQPGVEVGLAEAGQVSVSVSSGEPGEKLGGDGHALPP